MSAGLRVGLMIFQQVHNQRQAWKSSHDLHYKPKLVGNCTYLAFNVVQINKVNESPSESPPDGCLLISAYPDIAGQPTITRVRVYICVAGVVHAPRLVGQKWVSTRIEATPKARSASQVQNAFESWKPCPRTYKIHTRSSGGNDSSVALKGRVPPLCIPHSVTPR